MEYLFGKRIVKRTPWYRNLRASWAIFWLLRPETGWRVARRHALKSVVYLEGEGA